MLKPNSKLIKFYKGVCLEQIYNHMVDVNGSTMSKSEVDQEIKINAGFPYESCAEPEVQIEDLQNLIVWAFVYGDEQGIFIDYPPDELDKQIQLKI